MKIAFVGKGGSGKTTLTAGYINWLSNVRKREEILIIDADHNVHIRKNLEYYQVDFKWFSLENYFQKQASTIRTSLPENIDRLVYFKEIIKGINLLEIGKLSELREGSGCYHGQISDIEIFMNHLIDDQDDRIISDMTAGTDIFGSSYFAKFDILIGVCEPTEESISVIQDISSRARKYNIPFYSIINKYYDESDKEYIVKNLGNEGIIGAIPHQRVRNIKDIYLSETLFEDIENIVQHHKKNWNIFEENLRILHEKNRNSWAKNTLEQSNFSYSQLASNLGIR